MLRNGALLPSGHGSDSDTSDDSGEYDSNEDTASDGSPQKGATYPLSTGTIDPLQNGAMPQNGAMLLCKGREQDGTGSSDAGASLPKARPWFSGGTTSTTSTSTTSSYGQRETREEDILSTTQHLAQHHTTSTVDILAQEKDRKRVFHQLHKHSRVKWKLGVSSDPSYTRTVG